jgi:hypothetical protein
VTTATVSTTAATRTRDVLTLSLTRELEGTVTARPASASQRPASIKEAIVRWLNEEL